MVRSWSATYKEEEESIGHLFIISVGQTALTEARRNADCQAGHSWSGVHVSRDVSLNSGSQVIKQSHGGDSARPTGALNQTLGSKQPKSKPH